MNLKFIKMKKTIVVFTLLSLFVYSCNKQESGNKSIIKDENITITNKNGEIDSTVSTKTEMKDGESNFREESFRYVAEDGSSAKVTFVDTNNVNYITIFSNGKTIKADFKENKGSSKIYKNQDVEIKSDGDDLTITQGNNLIELRKAKGE